MTDPIMFQAEWKDSFLFSLRDNSSSAQDLKFLTSVKTNNFGSFFSPCTPSTQSTHLYHLFRPFDPFNTDDTDVEKLSTLLSRQLLKEVEVEPSPINIICSPLINNYQHSDIPTTITGSLWRYMDDDEKSNKTWSTCPFLSPPPPSPLKKQYMKDQNTNNDSNYNGVSSTKWNGPFGTPSEFDPTQCNQDTLDDKGTSTMISSSGGNKGHRSNKVGTLAVYDYDKEVTQQEQSIGSSTSIKKRQVCRYYLAGECYRKHCWYAHDLDVKPCKFW
ncbi:hypothetical protein BC941DRAFT_425556 [Chlamydoabsidia padenii]|nr:hypothetical protein BC941DRAFT_425556 [Chlamydoabsidia padenii]